MGGSLPSMLKNKGLFTNYACLRILFATKPIGGIIMHEQAIVERQLFASHMVDSWPM